MDTSSKAYDPDYARWVRKETWSVEQAALLFSGIAPDKFEPDEGVYERPPLGAPSDGIYPNLTHSWFLLIEAGILQRKLDAGLGANPDTHELQRQSAGLRLPPAKWIAWAEATCSGSLPTYLTLPMGAAVSDENQRAKETPEAGSAPEAEEMVAAKTANSMLVLEVPPPNSRKKHGPQPGTTNINDDKAFQAMSELIQSNKAKTPHGAAVKIVGDGSSIEGIGSPESKVRRLAKKFKNWRDKKELTTT